MRDRAVCGYVRPLPRRRRGAQALRNSTFTQPVTGGGCSVRHVTCPALSGYGAPARPHVVMGRLSEVGSFQRTLRTVGSLPISPCLRAVGEMLDPDRISGSCFLARATEQQPGRALSQRCEKVLRFRTICPLPRFRVSLPAGSPERFAGTVLCVPQMAPRLSWLVRQVSPNQRTWTCEKRRLRPRSSRRLRNLSMTSSSSSLRSVLASALPCSEEYAVDWWGPQTLRPARDWLLDGPGGHSFRL